MSLKPFTCRLPETRFLHAGRLVYKFKIRYGNFNRCAQALPGPGFTLEVTAEELKRMCYEHHAVSRPEATLNLVPDLSPLENTLDLDTTGSAVKELEEAIRVILGNLDDLRPFSTDHFTIFPYMSKWERVSKMRFKHENVHLVPYPYICTMYLELNSFQQSIPCGKEVNKGSDELVKRRNEVSESAAVEETVKRRRVEFGAEASHSQSDMDRTEADCVHHTSKAEHGFEMNSSKENEREFSPASLTVGSKRMSLWGHVGSNLEQRTGTGQAEGEVQLLQQMDQMINKGNMESGGRGLSRFWRSIIFSPLQHLFGGKN